MDFNFFQLDLEIVSLEIKSIGAYVLVTPICRYLDSFISPSENARYTTPTISVRRLAGTRTTRERDLALGSCLGRCPSLSF